jgi:hypothetical protein
VEALVRRALAGSRAVIEPAGIEEIMLYHVKENHG